MRAARIGVAVSAAVFVALGAVGISRADPEPPPPPPPTAQDQQFLNLVHSNGIGGQDDTLIAYAHEFCAGGPRPSGLTLVGQGVGFGNPGVFYAIQSVAARVYCPDRVPIPYVPPPQLQTPGPGLPR